jgi:short-subunit dehydrogenase
LQVRPSRFWHQGLYAATKFAVVALSEGLLQDLEPHGIGVSILPSQVATNICESDRNRQTRFGRPAEPAQNPEVADMLASGLDPLLVGERVVCAIRDNELYVFTHLEAEKILRTRHRAIEAAFGRTRVLLTEQQAEARPAAASTQDAPK